MLKSILILFIGIQNFCFAMEQIDVKKGSSQSVFKQDTHASKEGQGDNAARVDSQLTFKIPVGKAQEVYQYLRATYVESDEFVKKNFPGVDLKAQNRVDVSKFVDKYYDTANLDFYKNQNSVRQRKRINTTDANDRKSGRELVQLKYTPPGHFTMRNELKFKVKENEHKRGNGLLAQVQEDEQEEFIKAVKTIGFEVKDLRFILQNNQIRSRVYLNLDGAGFMSFSVDEFKTRYLWATAEAASVDLGLQENDFTSADGKRRELMWKIRNVIMKDLNEKFPYLAQNKEEKYVILLNQLQSQISYIPTLAKYGLLF